MKRWFTAVLAFAFLVVGYSAGTQAAVVDHNCPDFSSHQAVMDYWYSHGYSATNDPERLDGDNDGLPCEVTKGEYDAFIKSKQSTGGTLPKTATNNVSMIVLGTGVAALGLVLVLRRKHVKE